MSTTCESLAQECLLIKTERRTDAMTEFSRRAIFVRESTGFFFAQPSGLMYARLVRM